MEGLQRMPPDADSRSQSILLSYASASPTWHPHQQQNSSNSLSCSANQICGFSQLESEGNSSNLSFGSLDVRSNAQNAVFCNLDSSRGSLMLLDSSNASATLAFFPVHSVLPCSSSQNDHLSPLDQLTRAASVQRKRRKRKRIETTFTTLTSDNKPPVAPSSAY
uniref:Uncharacterized protein n=1 Tax=Plectus sambesii TaxID=2011161 RepID=A0A914V4A6_9BILA